MSLTITLLLALEVIRVITTLKIYKKQVETGDEIHSDNMLWKTEVREKLDKIDKEINKIKKLNKFSQTNLLTFFCWATSLFIAFFISLSVPQFLSIYIVSSSYNLYFFISSHNSSSQSFISPKLSQNHSIWSRMSSLRLK